jgi:flagellin
LKNPLTSKVNIMALTVNTNIASLSAQRNLTASQGDLSTSLQRLSSGLRINSARDDAAGLAISERFTSQIKGLNQGVRNANDGISLAQTAEGALKEVTNNLQRIRELAVQSANATNSASDRAALKAESDQLVAEIDRVASNTKFNGINLLDGTFTSQAFQVGADNGQTVSVSSISSARTSSLGAYFQATDTVTSGATASTGSNLSINSTSVIAGVDDGSGSTDADSSAKAMAVAINGSGISGVTAVASATVGNGATATDETADGNDSIILTINGTAVASVAHATSGATNAANMVNAINAVSASTGVTAAYDTTNGVVMTAADGRNITTSTVITDANTTGVALADFGLGADGTARGDYTITSTATGGINYDGTEATFGTGAVDTTLSSTGTAINAIDISTASNASTAITSIDAALATISSTRSDLGSYQSRFESVVANAQTAAENLSASRSRIMDADFASETASLTKSQILQQSGIAMLAQANSIPQNVLALLQ